MQSTRRQRLESVILEELSALVREVKDPRVPMITLTKVDLTEDARQATVYVSILRAELDDTPEYQAQMDECIEGLESAAAYLRRSLGKLLKIRHIPELVFRKDRGLENSLRVGEALKRIEAERKATELKNKPAAEEK